MARGLRLAVVDVGNTSTAVGLWSGGRVSKVAHCDGGFDEAAKVLSALCLVPSAELDGIAYVSVVPKEDAKWRKLAKELGLRMHQVSHRSTFFALHKAPGTEHKAPGTEHKALSTKHKALGTERSALTLDYPKPETIGADRLADAAGAVERYGAPVLVMDFGTALTAAVVTRDRVWRGGVIAPGFPLMRDYLFERTAKLPRMELGTGRAPKIGRSTEEAMRFGALVGYRGMVREIVAELKRNFREDFRLVATGGFARWALRSLDLPFTIDPTLTLYGTGLICSKEF